MTLEPCLRDGVDTSQNLLFRVSGVEAKNREYLNKQGGACAACTADQNMVIHARDRVPVNRRVPESNDRYKDSVYITAMIVRPYLGGRLNIIRSYHPTMSKQ